MLAGDAWRRTVHRAPSQGDGRYIRAAPHSVPTKLRRRRGLRGQGYGVMGTGYAIPYLTGYGDRIRNSLSHWLAALGFGPGFPFRRFRPSFRSARARKAAPPSGRPLPLSVSKPASPACSLGDISKRSPKPRRDGENGPHLNERVVPPSQVSAHARPFPFARRRAKPGAHRIEREIADGVQHMIIVHRHAAEPALEQMPGFARAGVDEGGVAPVGLADRARKAVARRGRQNEMQVVRHQAIGPARRRRSSRIVRRAGRDTARNRRAR